MAGREFSGASSHPLDPEAEGRGLGLGRAADESGAVSGVMGPLGEAQSRGVGFSQSQNRHPVCLAQTPYGENLQTGRDQAFRFSFNSRACSQSLARFQEGKFAPGEQVAPAQKFGYNGTVSTGDRPGVSGGDGNLRRGTRNPDSKVKPVWPDDYLIPGLDPYHVEDAGIIYCADCRDILPHLPKVDLVLTDPPYGFNRFPGDEPEKFLQIIRESFDVVPLIKGGWAFVFTGTGFLKDVLNAIHLDYQRLLWMYKPADCTFP